MNELNFFLSFSAGFLSFFSPCILPLIPAYLSSMGIVVFQEEGAAGSTPSQSRWRALLVTFFFVAGFSTIFLLLGFSAGLLGSLLLEYRVLLYRVGGAVVIIFSLHQLGLFKLLLFERNWNFFRRKNTSSTLAAAFILGAIFSLGWSPCVGPVLAGILFLSMGAGSPLAGGIYLLTYSLGMGIPFILLALFLDKLLVQMKKLHQLMPFFHLVSGIFLLVLGILLISGLFLRVTMLLS